MLYLLSCQEQEEQSIVSFCKEHLSQRAIQDVFLLTYGRMRRYERTWHLERKILFPSYVFLETEDSKRLSVELREYSNFAKQVDLLIPVNREEEILLRELYGKKRHLGISRGVIHKGITKVIEGPLVGMEDRICKIDRHKRLARIAANIKNPHYIQVGLEITEKFF